MPGNDALKTGWRRLVTPVLSRYYIRVQLISVLTRTDPQRNVSSQFRASLPNLLFIMNRIWPLQYRQVTCIIHARGCPHFRVSRKLLGIKNIADPPQILFMLLESIIEEMRYYQKYNSELSHLLTQLIDDMKFRALTLIGTIKIGTLRFFKQPVLVWCIYDFADSLKWFRDHPAAFSAYFGNHWYSIFADKPCFYYIYLEK